MKAYTDITVLLDRSGSMQSIRNLMESAYREFIQQHRAVPTTRLTLIQFDTDNPQDVIYENVPVDAAPPLLLEPRGGTPLLDALCRAIDRAGVRLAALPEAERPDSVLFVIITDGLENASAEFTRTDVHRRVTSQRQTYHWQFVYLGANQDAFAEAAAYGISKQNALNYRPSASGVRAMSSALINNSVAYASRVNRSAAIDAFSPDATDVADDQ